MPEQVHFEGEHPNEDFAVTPTEAPKDGTVPSQPEPSTPEPSVQDESQPTPSVETPSQSSDNRLSLSISLEDQSIDLHLDIYDLFWNSASIENIGVTVQALLGRYGRSASQIEERGQILHKVIESDPRLQRISLYWDLYEKGLLTDSSAAKRMLAQQMLAIREEYGLRDLPEDYFDPVSNLLEDDVISP